jgi:hypothetical protein
MTGAGFERRSTRSVAESVGEHAYGCEPVTSPNGAGSEVRGAVESKSGQPKVKIEAFIDA